MSDRASWIWPDRRTSKSTPPIPAADERRSGRERRRAARIRFSLELAVPVLVRGANGLQHGLARNISEGGMLIEVLEPPPIGTGLEVTISGVQGSEDAPDAITLYGDVRHHIAWQYNAKSGVKSLRGIGVRFADKPEQMEPKIPIHGPLH